MHHGTAYTFIVANRFTMFLAPCGFTAFATNISQVLNSPGWPNRYEDRLQCEWTITAREGARVRLDLNYFYTERCCDYLKVGGRINVCYSVSVTFIPELTVHFNLVNPP